MGAELVILGIDPGSRSTGYALARFAAGRVEELDWGVWRPPARLSRAASLGWLASTAEEWIAERVPAAAAVESLFHHKNARSLLVLSEARGVLLSVLGRLGVEVAEYPPATVKKTICGFGTANKDQVRRALLRTVPGVARFETEGLPEDASDALAMAVCHSVHARHGALLRRDAR